MHKKGDFVRFSRDNLTEFLSEMLRETVKITLSFSHAEDEAVLFLPFESRALVVKGGQYVVWGDEIPGAIPCRRIITVQNIVSKMPQ